MNGFGVENLPFGVARFPGGRTACVTALDDDVIDLARLADRGLFDLPGEVFLRSSLNAFLACGRRAWERVRAGLGRAVAAGDERLAASRTARVGAELLLPVAVGDYVDFSASLHHATRMGRLLRPGDEPLPPNWRRRPVAYHGRAGSIVVSGAPIVRPHGQIADRGGGEASVRPTEELDIEAEVAFVVGAGSRLGEPVKASAFRDHVAGVLLLNDWSARDIQAFEQRPLGPFLAKSFGTSVSPWLVTLDALEPFSVDGTYDLRLEVELQGTVVSRPTYTSMHWTPAELLAHLTLNGAALRPGDLFASGTVSGPDLASAGCLTELTELGRRPLQLPDGTVRAFLHDGDTVTVRGVAGAGCVSLGEVTGTVYPARRLEG